MIVSLDDDVGAERAAGVGHRQPHRRGAFVRSTKLFCFGHVWVVLCVVVQPSFSHRPWALPVLFRLYRSKAPKPSPQPPKVESERPAPVHYPVRRWVPIDEVTWHDEAVSAPQFGITRAHCDDAQEVFEPLKRQLAADAEGAKVRCVLDRSAEGRLVWTAQAPAGLIALFERRRRDEALEGVRVQTRPVTLTSISKALGHANPEDIIEDGDVVALERRDALRWLFARRSHDQEPYLWRDNALLIPLGDRGLFAWEHLKEDNATYLFWPKDVDALLDLVSRDQWRRELRERPQSEETAAAGGLKRVIHKGDIEGWQRRIQAAIDSAGRQAP